jgi:ABC-type molybdate transport system ATPase subunit
MGTDNHLLREILRQLERVDGKDSVRLALNGQRIWARITKDDDKH